MRSLTIRAFLLFAFTADYVYPGKFNHSFMSLKSDEVTLQVPRPADAYVARKNMAVEVGEAPPLFRDKTGLRLSVEQALAPDFTPVTAPEVVFKVSIINFTPPVTQTHTQTETRNMKVGRRAVMRNGQAAVDSKGNIIYEDVYENRQVPVEYWEGRGALSAKVEVWETNGALLDGYSPSSTYSTKRVIAVNHESQLGSQMLPDAASMLAEMIKTVAASFGPRYRNTFNLVKFKLACDDELRAGNATAMNGAWEAALKQWEGASLKKNPGDRTYNMAVAHEALAYQTYKSSQSTDEAEPLFARSMQLYAEAMRLDPEEKYIQQAAKRLEMAKVNIENAKKQYAAQRFEAEKALAELDSRRKAEEAARIEQEVSARELSSAREDSPQEKSFRQMARLRLKAGVFPVPDPDRERLEATGVQAFKLTALQAKRVVSQEIVIREKLSSNLAIYKENVAAFAADNRISSEERGVLAELARNLELSSDDVTGVESGYKLQEPARKTGADPIIKSLVPPKQPATIKPPAAAQPPKPAPAKP